MILKLLRYKSYLDRILPYFVLFFPALFYSWTIRSKAKYRGIWLISERGNEARDNSYHLYKYIKNKHPEINSYFVITEDSPDIKKVAVYGNLIKANSFQHFLYFILADKLISTHMYGAAPFGKACLPFLKLLPQKKHILLRHGVAQSAVEYKNNNLNLIVCASDMEIECMKGSNENIKKAIKILGLCRYDSLSDKSKVNKDKYLLIMPTFRKWLEHVSRLPNCDYIFRKDPYYAHWNELLNDERILEICEKNNITIIFYPHYRIQKYLHNFKSCSNYVIIADNSKYDIQELLINSSMLITDFSSVFFDFAYMGKPVAYYQFDTERFRKDHYRQGVFTFEDNGFGPVFSRQDALVNYIIDRIDNEFEMEKKYLNRSVNFFKYSDRRNTDRNFNEILRL